MGTPLTSMHLKSGVSPASIYSPDSLLWDRRVSRIPGTLQSRAGCLRGLGDRAGTGSVSAVTLTVAMQLPSGTISGMPMLIGIDLI